jgi:hypothetical protein
MSNDAKRPPNGNVGGSPGLSADASNAAVPRSPAQGSGAAPPRQVFDPQVRPEGRVARAAWEAEREDEQRRKRDDDLRRRQLAREQSRNAGPQGPNQLWIPPAAWLNADPKFNAADLAGQVVLLVRFRMVQPNALTHTLPMAERMHRMLEPFGCRTVGLEVGRPIKGVDPLLAYGPVLKGFGFELPVGFVVREELRALRYEKEGTPVLDRLKVGDTPIIDLYDRTGRRTHAAVVEDDIVVTARMVALAVGGPNVVKQLLAEEPTTGPEIRTPPSS